MVNATEFIPDFLDDSNKIQLKKLIENIEIVLNDLFGGNNYRLIPFLPPIKLWIHSFSLLEHLINYQGALNRLYIIKASTIRSVDEVVSIPVSSLHINESGKVSSWIYSCVSWLIATENGLKNIQRKIT